MAEFQRALEFSPSNAVVHFALWQTYSGIEDPVKATEHLEAALQVERGEMSQESRRAASSKVIAMKTIFRSRDGDADARSELQRLAEAGDATAQVGMANAAFDARRDDDGLNWLLRAAQQGNAQSQYDYAKNLFLLRPESRQEVVQWLTRAAKQGHSDAQFSLGKILYEGASAPRDNVAAGQWILLASGAGQKEAKYLWQEMELFLSADELAAVRKLAADFKPADERPAK